MISWCVWFFLRLRLCVFLRLIMRQAHPACCDELASWAVVYALINAAPPSPTALSAPLLGCSLLAISVRSCWHFSFFLSPKQLQKAIEGSTRSGVRLRPPLASFRDASRKAKKHQPSSSTASSPTRDRDLWGEGSRREGDLMRRQSRDDSKGKTPYFRGGAGSSASPSLCGSSGAERITQDGASSSTSTPNSPSPPTSPVILTSPVITLSSLQEERESEESDEPIWRPGVLGKNFFLFFFLFDRDKAAVWMKSVQLSESLWKPLEIWIVFFYTFFFTSEKSVHITSVKICSFHQQWTGR